MNLENNMKSKNPKYKKKKSMLTTKKLFHMSQKSNMLINISNKKQSRKNKNGNMKQKIKMFPNTEKTK